MSSVWMVLAVRQAFQVQTVSNQQVNSIANCTAFANQAEAVKYAEKLRTSTGSWNVAVKEIPIHAKAETAPDPMAGGNPFPNN